MRAITTVDALPYLFRRLAPRRTLGEDRPSGTRAANLLGGDALVAPIVPLQKIIAALCAGTEARELAGLTGRVRAGS
jgi:hypothetical protein